MTLISIAHQNGKGCLSVAYSKMVAVQLTWAAVWWLVELGSWLAAPKEGSFLLLFHSPNPSRGQLCSVIRDKARGKRVIFLASFKLHHFTKWSNKDPTQTKGVCVQLQELEQAGTRGLWLSCRLVHWLSWLFETSVLVESHTRIRHFKSL